MNSNRQDAKAAKDAEVVPVEVNVSTAMPKGMADALYAANATTKELIHSALDRFSATSPVQAAKITRISVKQTFTIAPECVQVDLEIKQ